ncbi:MAG: alpha/beta hydrolase [Anaerolineales bacterium]|nr:alpha/beta hydrolase [Anaerolineales bacterium]
MAERTESSSIPRTQALTKWGISLVNGFFGDYLRDSENGLATDMALRHAGRPLSITPDALRSVHPDTTGRLVILVHGLGCHEGIWQYPEPGDPALTTTYGEGLHREHGYTPFYLRYNTGLALAENGAHFATLLNRLLSNYPTPVTEIVLIGHSMGGLVIRSACHYGASRQAGWVERVRRVFYLASPHEGAPLAKFAHWTTDVMQAARNPVTQLIGDALNARSQGVKDLRHGAPLHHDGQSAPWLGHARHYLIVGTLHGDTAHAASVLFGDGLVRQRSAKGGSSAATAWAGDEQAPPAEIDVLPGIHHLRLAHDPAVFHKISQQCRQRTGGVVDNGD